MSGTERVKCANCGDYVAEENAAAGPHGHAVHECCTVRSGTIDVGLKIAALASELGFKAGEYQVEDVWVAGEEEIEVDLRKVDAGTEQGGRDA